ncbi:aspartate/glutamate racemase family protein [Desulfoplanes sp.]
MKTIGLLGGMSWESTAGYYRIINQGIKEQLGGLHSARIAMYSVDFGPIEELMRAGDWDGIEETLVGAAQGIQKAGADCLLICTNTMHKLADHIQVVMDIPLLHIADATAEILVRDGITTVGLLGTAPTMEQDFYKGRLSDRHGLNVLIPNHEDRRMVHKVIFQELCKGDVRSESRDEFLRIIDDLAARGAGAVILGCTEIGMLVSPADTRVRLLDTTVIHAEKAVAFALG